MKLTIFRIVAAATVLGALLSCGSKTETNVEKGNREQILFVANGSEPRELDPLLTTGAPEHNILMALFEGLVNEHPKTLAITPGVAESWTVSDDAKTYTFQLRDTAKWSNGEKLTAHDFVYAWKRSLMPNFGSQWAYMKYFIRGAKAFHMGETDDFSTVGVKATSDSVFEVELANATPFFLKLLVHNSYYPVHQATIEKFAPIDQPISDWTKPANFVGNGAFVLSEWKLNNLIASVKNTEYWDAANVKLNGVTFFPIEDQQAEVRAFRSGQVHVTHTPTMAIEKIGYYQENEPEVLDIVQTYSSYYYELNTTKPPFDDARVRRALAMAIDRDLLVGSVSKGGQSPGYTLVPPDPQGYTAKFHFGYDIEKAKALLAEAGYPNGEGFPETSILYNSQDDHRKIALAIQQMWKSSLNIDVGLNNQEWKVYLNSRKNYEHDIARAGWIADYVDPSNFFEVFLSTSGNNHSGWKNAEYDALIQQMQEEAREPQRFELFEKANKLLADEMPIIPIYYYTDINLISPSVQGWYGNVKHSHPYNRVYLEEVKK